jgi:hypothetical protein
LGPQVRVLSVYGDVVQRWIRPYGGRPGDVLVGVTVGVALIAMLLQLCGGLLREPLSVGAIAVLVAFDIAFLIGVWRTLSIGLFINEHGIKVKRVWRTRVFAWTEVILVRAGTANVHHVRAIVVTVRDPRRTIETPIWCKDGSRVRRNRIWLKSDEFNRLIDQLNLHVARHSPPGLPSRE